MARTTATAAVRQRRRRPVAVTPDRKVAKAARTASKTRPPKDKYELSPNNLAKCRRCKKKIAKGDRRVGKTVYADRYGYYHQYYHDTCFPAGEKVKLNLSGGATAEDEIARQNKEQLKKSKLIRQRSALRERLRKLRMHFATRLHVQAYRIFPNTTLDDIVARLPTSKSDLLQVNGFAEKRYTNFGRPVLQVVRAYVDSTRKVNRSAGRRVTATATSSAAAAAAASLQGEDEAVEVVASMSIEDIVARRFEEAAKTGCMISIDQDGEEQSAFI